jgi:hypothetical protein
MAGATGSLKSPARRLAGAGVMLESKGRKHKQAEVKRAVTIQ